MATGTTRNKVALKPGHSLMDWVRLGNSGEDLTGFKGRTISVSGDELAKHNKRDDAWMAIRGKVYNVTRYMDFHPGGVDELMRGVGRDATKLFDEVHAWVNYQQLLAKCCIGPLKNTIKIDRNIFHSLKPKLEPLSMAPLLFQPAAVEIIPRFDWTQKRTDITMYFYTKQDCNPGLIVHHKNNQEIRLLIIIDHRVHQFDLELQNEINWPAKSTHVNSETGKIEVVFKKSEDILWTLYGSQTVKQLTINDMEKDADNFYFDFEVISNEKINHDSTELCLRCVDNIFIPPVGFHVTVGAFIKGTLLRRSYTPVDSKFASKSVSLESQLNLCFLIKNYGTNGLLSTHLSQIPLKSTLQISLPKGNFQLKKLNQYRHVILIAAGSGLTPILSLIDYIFKCSNKKREHIVLLYFNKTEKDIWCREILEKMEKEHEEFQLINILSQPTSEWIGLKGYVSVEILSSTLKNDFVKTDTFVAACGSKVFNVAVESSLKELEYKSENIHIFY